MTTRVAEWIKNGQYGEPVSDVFEGIGDSSKSYYGVDRPQPGYMIKSNRIFGPDDINPEMNSEYVWRYIKVRELYTDAPRIMLHEFFENFSSVALLVYYTIVANTEGKSEKSIQRVFFGFTDGEDDTMFRMIYGSPADVTRAYSKK